MAALRHELTEAKTIAAKASATWDKFRKERDFHRMHHKRVAQEKNKLINDIKRLKVRSGALYTARMYKRTLPTPCAGSRVMPTISMHACVASSYIQSSAIAGMRVCTEGSRQHISSQRNVLC